MGRIATALAAATLSLASLACVGQERWVDKALLHDGRIVDVQRTVDFHFGSGTPSFTRWPDQYTLQARNPDTRKIVRWSGERHFNPVLLDFQGEVAWLVIVASSVAADLKPFDCPQFPYIFLRQDGSRWTRVPATEFPRPLMRANLSFQYDVRYMKGGRRQSAEDIENGNRMAERSSEGFLARDIPSDFASWRFGYKNEYRVASNAAECVAGKNEKGVRYHFDGKGT
jgi:hypothetical protein